MLKRRHGREQAEMDVSPELNNIIRSMYPSARVVRVLDEIEREAGIAGGGDKAAHEADTLAGDAHH